MSSDPEWKDGDYTAQPRAGIQTATDLLVVAGAAPTLLQKNYPTREEDDKYVYHVEKRYSDLDANDILYAVSSSRNYSNT